MNESHELLFASKVEKIIQPAMALCQRVKSGGNNDYAMKPATFLKSAPFCVNGSTFVLKCTYGGNSEDIYRFSPEDCSLEGDCPEDIAVESV